MKGLAGCLKMQVQFEIFELGQKLYNNHMGAEMILFPKCSMQVYYYLGIYQHRSTPQQLWSLSLLCAVGVNPTIH